MRNCLPSESEPEDFLGIPISLSAQSATRHIRVTVSNSAVDVTIRDPFVSSSFGQAASRMAFAGVLTVLLGSRFGRHYSELLQASRKMPAAYRAVSEGPAFWQSWRDLSALFAKPRTHKSGLQLLRWSRPKQETGVRFAAPDRVASGRYRTKAPTDP
jgi:hypothetical protein